MYVAKNNNAAVVGRFAPSPTGPLHFGSLVAALGSYLFAKQAGGRWLLRVEDLDPPRVVPGSADLILRQLEECGFEWDGPVVYQSRRFERYHQIIVELKQRQLLFECSCSRRELVASAPHLGEEGPVYPGTCREGPVGKRAERALRLRVPDEQIECHDGVFGLLSQNLQRELGDFVLLRADGYFAYQLAVVVDDIDSGVTQVVRGADLISSTIRQVYLYRCLGQPPPSYFHLPLALGADREKISKRHGDSAILTSGNSRRALWLALRFLGQQPPEQLAAYQAAEILAWAEENFVAEAISSGERPAPDLDSC